MSDFSFGYFSFVKEKVTGDGGTHADFYGLAP